MKKYHFKKGQTVTLKATRHATTGTESIVFEKGPRFVVEFEGTQINNKMCAFFKSLDDSWAGWLPVEEISVVTSL